MAAVGLVDIGAHCMLANGCFVTDGSHRFDDPDRPVPWQGFTTKGPTVIGDNVWCGANVVVTSGVTIGRRCVIGANSVVTRDLPPFSIAAGSPARVLRSVEGVARAPMTFHRDAADGIHRVTDGPVNWYLVEDEDGVTIVDAGLPTSWNSLGWGLAEIGRRRSDVKALVLTHAHFDHVGFAERARRELGIPVFLHPGDRPLSRHPLRYDHERHPALYLCESGRGDADRRDDGPRRPARARDRRDRPTSTRDGPLDVPGRPRVIHTPGHTHGHVSLHFADRDALIAGDAVVTLDPYTAKTRAPAGGPRGDGGQRARARLARRAGGHRRARSCSPGTATRGRTEPPPWSARRGKPARPEPVSPS